MPKDVWLWVRLGILGYMSALAAHWQLQAVRKATTITVREKHKDPIGLDSADALKLETLATLVESTNREISAAAVKVITERALRLEVYCILLQDIAGKNAERREQGLTSLKYLIKIFDLSSLSTYINIDTVSFKAVVTCLCNILDDYKIPDDFKDQTTHSIRTQSEWDALHIVIKLFPLPIASALHAGLVTRWLKRYPFGGNYSSVEQRRAIIQKLSLNDTEDGPMSFIVHKVVNDPLGRAELVACDLLSQRVRRLLDEQERTESSSFPTMMGRGRRIREESLEEQALRRRRREAMVLHEGRGPLERSDIIQRDDTLHRTAVELDNLRLQVADAREISNNQLGQLRAQAALAREQVDRAVEISELAGPLGNSDFDTERHNAIAYVRAQAAEVIEQTERATEEVSQSLANFDSLGLLETRSSGLEAWQNWRSSEEALSGNQHQHDEFDNE